MKKEASHEKAGKPQNLSNQATKPGARITSHSISENTVTTTSASASYGGASASHAFASASHGGASASNGGASASHATSMSYGGASASNGGNIQPSNGFSSIQTVSTSNYNSTGYGGHGGGHSSGYGGGHGGGNIPGANDRIGIHGGSSSNFSSHATKHSSHGSHFHASEFATKKMKIDLNADASPGLSGRMATGVKTRITT